MENQFEPVKDECLAWHWVSRFKHLKAVWLVQYLAKDSDAHSQQLMDCH